MPDSLFNPDSYDKVIIHDLVVEMSAGIYDFEKKNKQRVIFNIDLYVDKNFGKKINDISAVVSYEDICNLVQEICRKKHYDLLEELAEHICKSCLKNKLIHKIGLRVEKPDIIKNTKSVGIEIKRP